MTPSELKHLRTKRGWSQERLSRELAVSASTVVRWESDGGSIPGPAQIALQAILGDPGSITAPTERTA
jgi:DNA-binding transcriptional regulator YiaG